MVVDGDDRSNNDGKDEDCIKMGTLGEQLHVTARLKWISVANVADGNPFLDTLRCLQEILRAPKRCETVNICAGAESNAAGA